MKRFSIFFAVVAVVFACQSAFAQCENGQCQMPLASVLVKAPAVAVKAVDNTIHFAGSTVKNCTVATKCTIQNAACKVRGVRHKTKSMIRKIRSR